MEEMGHQTWADTQKTGRFVPAEFKDPLASLGSPEDEDEDYNPNVDTLAARLPERLHH
jgi:hypothetical protein